LNGKTVLEYGPGDILDLAVFMYANGASKVYCIDRFPLQSMTEKNKKVYEIILEKLQNEYRIRATNVFDTISINKRSNKNKIIYITNKYGLSEKKITLI
jgi:hypothetical protein